MKKFDDIENSRDELPAVDMDRLSSIIESQIDHVAGGGFSEYTCCHKETVKN